MSSSDEDAHEHGGRAAFTVDNDFEGGQWVGGEFYAKGRRKGRQMTREEAIYGVFAGDAPRGGIGSHHHASRSGNGSSKTRYAAPMAFVQAATGGGDGGDGSTAVPRPQHTAAQGSSANGVHDDRQSNDTSQSVSHGSAPPSLEATTGASQPTARPGLGARHHHGSTTFRPGLGSATSRPGLGSTTSRPGLGSGSRPGLGSSSSRPGLGSQNTSSAAPSQPKSNADFASLFVKSSAKSTKPTPVAEDATKSEADAGGAVSKDVFNRLVRGPAATEATPSAGPSPPPGFVDPKKAAIQAQKMRTIAKDREWGKFEKHTKGFGLKYLSKFNFKGALGKEGQGITRPIQAVQRGDGKSRPGLGMVQESTAINREVAKEFFGGEDADNRKDSGGSDSDDSLAGWKKPGKGQDRQPRRRRRKRVYRTGAGAPTEAPAAQKQVFVDMTGHKPRRVSNFDRLASRRSSKRGNEAATTSDSDDEANAGGRPDTGSKTHKKRLGRELVHNVAALAEQAEMQLQRASHAATVARNKLRSNDADTDAVQQRASAAASELSELRDVEALLTRARNRAKEAAAQATAASAHARHHTPSTPRGESVEDDTALLAIDALREVISSIRLHHAHVYAVYEIYKFAVPLLQPVLSAFVAGWDPLDAEVTRALCAALGDWRKLLYADLPKTAGQRNPLAALADREGGPGSQGMVFDDVVEAALVPRVQSSLMSRWQVKQQATEAVALVQSLEFLLSESVNARIVDTVERRLQRTVAQWDPRTDATPIHEWTQPWLAVLGNRLAPVWSTVVFKLGAVLGDWTDVTDGSALEVLQPWQRVFSAKAMLGLLSRAVIPKLAAALRKIVINPSDQRDVDVFKAVVQWHSLVPARHMSALLQGEFFPQWLQTLADWLSSDGMRCAEVAAWYQGWKRLIPTALLHARTGPIARSFNRALAMMDATMGVLDTGGTPAEIATALAPLMPTVRGDAASLDHNAAVAGRRDARASPEVAPSAAGSAPHKAAKPVHVTFRGAVELLAQRHGVPFVPHPRRPPHDGNPVYLFGPFTVFTSAGVLFAEEGSGAKAQFRPVDPKELLQRAVGRKQ